MIHRFTKVIMTCFDPEGHFMTVFNYDLATGAESVLIKA